MGFGSQSIEFIRKFFRQGEFERAPFVPVTAYGTLSHNAPYFSYGMTSGSLQGVTDYLRVDADLVGRYIDYEDQDDNPLISSALDIYADDSTQVDSEKGKTVWIESEDEDVRRELDDMLHIRLKIEEHIWAMTRVLCKYGNNYFEIVAQEKKGVIAMNPLAPPTCRRVEVPKEIGERAEDRADLHWDTLGFIYDPRGVFKISTNQFIEELKFRVTGQVPGGERPSGVAVFESWEVVHMRLSGRNPATIYGYGLGEPARWIFKRLLLLEDSIILHRLTRAPSRFAFYVDVSGIPPNEVGAYLTRVKQGLKKQKFVNPATNKLDQKYNVISSDEDFFLPMREGRETTRVESLQGPIYDHIEDIKFFENKLFAALKVPKPFLTYEESTAKTHLSAEDARFARTIIRIQREIRNGIKKVCKVHLAAKGVNPDAVDFDVCMTIPSAIFELAQLEIRNAELELAEKYKGWAPLYWIKTRVLGWSDDQIREMNLYGDEGPDEDQLPTGGMGSSGALEKALSKRGSPKSGGDDDKGGGPPVTKKTTAPKGTATPGGGVVTPGEAGAEGSQVPALMLSGIQKSFTKGTSTLVEKMNSQNKLSDKRTDELLSRIQELRHMLETKK